MVRDTRTRRTLTALLVAALLVVPTGAAAAAPTDAQTADASAALDAPVVAHAGADTGDDADASDADDENASADDAVSFVRTIEEMKGHLAVSARYANDGNAEMAAHHAGHPHEEYWSAVNATLSDANASLAADLEAKLLAAPDRARNDSGDAYAAYVNETLFPAFDDAERAVAGDRVDDAAFTGKVASALLQRAVQEYGEGVAANGTIVERMEYDDAHGFALRADALYRAQIRSTLDDHARDELDELHASLADRIANSASPEDLESTTSSIAAEYGEYLGIDTGSGETDAEETVETIKSNLDEAADAYAAGNDAEAKEMIRQTYLSHFEGLEGPLIEKRPELVNELEADFNEELPGLIDENASASEVRSKVDEMGAKLDTAAEVLSETDTETTINLENQSTSTTDETTTDTSETTSGSSPGLGAGAALLALLGTALVAMRRHT